MPALALSLLGPPRLELDGVSLEFKARKNLALISYLATTGERHSREELVTLLWPELEPSRARSGLRRNLSILKKTLSGEWLVVDRESVGLDPAADVWFDVARFHALLRAWQDHGHPEVDVCSDCLTALAEAVELYRGDFLAGFTLRDSPGFDEWQFFQTEGLRQELASTLERQVRGYSQQGAYPLAIPYARRWVSLDPLHEPAHRHLMRLYVWSGQRAAALRQYAECDRVLQEALAAPPGEDTTQLFETIKARRDLPPPGRGGAAPGTTQAGLRYRGWPARHDGGASLLHRMRHGQLVGRERELAELRGSWERATRGEGHMVLISGEPGIGKSRLAEEIKAHAQMCGGLVLEGRFYAKHEVPYLGFWEALRDYIRSRPPAVAEEEIGATAPELVKLVPEIRQIVAEIVPNPPLGDASAERLRMFDQTTQFLLGLSSESPLLFVLDDLHWADEASLFLLHFILRNIQASPILLVGTYRESEVDPRRPLYETLVGLNRERLYSRLILRRLSGEDVEELVNALLDGPVDEGLAAEIVQETEGNPFFVEEVIKSLLEREALGNDGDRWAPLPGIELEMPQSIRVTIGQRLARLSKDGRLALTQAAILGRNFDFELLLEMGDWDEDQLLAALERIEQAQLASEIKGATELRYRFGHALVAQVLYEDLNARRRARYHLSAGEAIERVHANRLGSHVAALAHHFSLAPTGAAEKAVDYGLLAAKEAVAVHAHEQALSHYVNALEAIEDLDAPLQKAGILELLGDTHLTTFFVEKAIRAYEDALHVLEEAGETEVQTYSRLHAKLGRVLAREKKDPARARAHLNSALERISADSAEGMKCLAALAQCMVQEQNVPQAHQQAQLALELATSGGQPGAVASASEALCAVYVAMGDMEAYFSTDQMRIAACEGDDDLHGLFLAYRSNIWRSFLAGDYREGEQWALDSMRISAELNAPGWESTSLAGYTGILAEEGRWSEAQACSERLLPLFNRVGSKGCFGYILLSLAEVEARLGNHEQARKYIRDAEDIWYQLLGPENHRIYQWRFFGHLFLEEWEPAWEQVERKRARFGPETGAATYAQFLWTISVPQVAARVGRWPEAASLAQEMLALFRQPRLPLGLAMARITLGLVHAGQRQWEQSLREYEAAIALFQELGHPWDMANTRLEMGLVLSARQKSGDLQAARSILMQALSGFESLDARPGMGRASSALERMR